MNKQVSAFYDMANEYYVAATTLWSQIVEAPYLYSPISFLLRHTIELQLKGLIILELRKDCCSLKISDISVSNGNKMSSTHSIKKLWEYFKQLFLSHSLSVFESEFKMCDKAFSRLDKKDFSSTRYRYPISKDNSSINYDPINIFIADKAPDISKGIPSVAIGEKTICIIDKGQRLLDDTRELFDIVEFLFELF